MSKPASSLCQPVAADTFPRFLHSCAEVYGDAVAVRFTGETLPDETLTFRALERRSAQLGRGLLVRGVGKGTRVGFIFGNGPEFAVLLSAIARIGAIAVPISTLIRAAEMARVLRQSDVHGVIVQRRLLGNDLLQRVVDSLPELAAATGPDLRLNAVPYLRWILTSGPGLPPGVGAISGLADAAGGIDEALLCEIESEVHPADQMLEIYTSGSMALPKGVKHDHGPVLRRVHYLARMVGRLPGSELQLPLPMFWVGGLGLYFLVNLASGVTSVCTERTVTNRRASRGNVISDDELKLRQNGKPYWSLGMTETFGPYGYGDGLRVDGHPLAPPIDHVAEGFELRVVDANNHAVAGDEIGEIQVRGAAVTLGLHKIERSEYFTPDGFYRTGDLGQLDGCRIHFYGRNGDMIKTAKANVSPAEVEFELQQLAEIDAAFVVGLPDAERGQIVAAAVIAATGAQLDFVGIEAYLRGRMSGYKIPRAYVEFAAEEVPMLPSNKVARRELATALERRLGRS